MLRQRVITAIVLVLLIGFTLFGLDPMQFGLVLTGVFALAAWEWSNLSGVVARPWRLLIVAVFVVGTLLLRWWTQVLDGAVLIERVRAVLLCGGVFWLLAIYCVATYPATTRLWHHGSARLVSGALILWPAWLALVYLRSLDQGIGLFLYVAALVSAADIGAYFVGRAFGKRKLAPKVSPGKSWAGFFGGLASTAALACVVGSVTSLQMLTLPTLVVITLVASVASVFGDLTESMLKRERGIKDSSNLLPGHGGVLDRIDSVTAAAPVFALLLLLSRAT